jgi:hypothetical protein
MEEDQNPEVAFRNEIVVWSLAAGRDNAVRTLSSEYGEVTVEERPMSDVPEHVQLKS